MKLFLINIIIIITTMALLFAITLLLDLSFIQAQPVRQILVYILMVIVLFVLTRALILINKGPQSQK